MLPDSIAFLGILGLPSGWEWIILVVLGLLLFGKKLPGIARSLGQSVIEFKKGIRGEPGEPPASLPAAQPQQPAQIQAQPAQAQAQVAAPQAAAPAAQVQTAAPAGQGH